MWNKCCYAVVMFSLFFFQIHSLDRELILKRCEKLLYGKPEELKNNIKKSLLNDVVGSNVDRYFDDLKYKIRKGVKKDIPKACIFCALTTSLQALNGSYYTLTECEEKMLWKKLNETKIKKINSLKQVETVFVDVWINYFLQVYAHYQNGIEFYLNKLSETAEDALENPGENKEFVVENFKLPEILGLLNKVYPTGYGTPKAKLIEKLKNLCDPIKRVVLEKYSNLINDEFEIDFLLGKFLQSYYSVNEVAKLVIKTILRVIEQINEEYGIESLKQAFDI